MVLPLLIASVMVALAYFYVQTSTIGSPSLPEVSESGEDQDSSRALEKNYTEVKMAAVLSEKPDRDGKPMLRAVPVDEPVEDPVEEPLEEPIEEPVAELASFGDSASEGAHPLDRVERRSAPFTSWLSTTALDTYVRARNAGYSESFWKRGHWIPAVEGRWGADGQEFRIVIETMPEPDSWEWQYRIGLTESDFSSTAYDLQRQGFRLIHHQIFVDGNSLRRVQAVWQRHRGLGDPAQVADSRGLADLDGAEASATQ